MKDKVGDGSERPPRVPSVEQEDRKRLHRERQRLVKGEYLKLCVWRSAHAVKTGHLLNRSG